MAEGGCQTRAAQLQSPSTCHQVLATRQGQKTQLRTSRLQIPFSSPLRCPTVRTHLSQSTGQWLSGQAHQQQPNLSSYHVPLHATGHPQNQGLQKCPKTMANPSIRWSFLSRGDIVWKEPEILTHNLDTQSGGLSSWPSQGGAPG